MPSVSGSVGRIVGLTISVIVLLVMGLVEDTALSPFYDIIADAGYGWVVTALAAILAIVDVIEIVRALGFRLP